MKKFIKYTSTVTVALAAIVSVWFLLNNLQPLSPGLYSFAILCIVGVIIFLKLFASTFLRRLRILLVKIVNYRYFTLITLSFTTLLAIIVRLYFYSHFSYAPVSDPVTFYDAAQKIANSTGLTGNSYPAFFPYLAAYDNVLGVAMKVIRDPWLATILPNTIFDIAAAFIVYFLTKKLSKPSSKLPILAFAVWLLNPFNIIFSTLSLPIIIVNFFIIATVLLVYLLIKEVLARRIIQSLVCTLLLGVTIGIGNCFRPIFIIALVALFLLFVYTLLTHRNTGKLLLFLGVSFLLIVVIFFGVQKANLTLVAKETGLTPASNASGWSIYIGSNSATNGTWNQADQDRMSQICKDEKSFDDCHQKLQKVGIERYKSYGIGGSLNLFIRKLYVFSSDQGSTYNANDSLGNYANSKTQKIMNVYITIFIIVLFCLSSWYLYYAAKTIRSTGTISPTVLFVALLVLGFSLSDMFVEAAERYAQIMYPLFILTSVLSLETFKRRPGKSFRDF